MATEQQVRDWISQLLDPSKVQEALVGLVELTRLENLAIDDSLFTYISSALIGATADTIPILLSCLSSPHEIIRDKATSLVRRTIAFVEEGAKKLVTSHDGIAWILACVSDPKSAVNQRVDAIYAIRNMARYEFVWSKLEDAGAAQALIQIMKSINGPCEQLKLLSPAAEALAGLRTVRVDKEIIASGLFEHLKQLAESDGKEVQIAAISGIGGLLIYSISLRNHATEIGIFEVLLPILHSTKRLGDNTLVCSAVKTCNHMVAGTNYQLVLKNGVYDRLIQLLKEDDKSLIEDVLSFLADFSDNFREGQEAMMQDSTVMPRLLQLVQDGYYDTILIFCFISQHENAKTMLCANKIVETVQPLLHLPQLDEEYQAMVALTLANLSNDRQGISIESTIIKDLTSTIADILSGKNTSLSLLTVVNGIANLASNDHNKQLMGELGVIPIMLDILHIVAESCKYLRVAKHLDETKVRSATALWNLAYHEPNRRIMMELDAVKILTQLAAVSDGRLQKNVKGTLWLLGVRDEAPTDTQDASLGPIEANDMRTDDGKHVMISYNWDNQLIVKQIAQSLKESGYKVWLDIEQMGGSTLEAMANAIEHSELVLICMSQKYKDSPNCRLEGKYCVSKRKPYVPLMMQKGYSPDGWLGITLGSKLWYDFTNDSEWDSKIADLTKAVGELGKLKTKNKVPSPAPKHEAHKSVIDWPPEDLLAWLKSSKIKNPEEQFKLLRAHEVDGQALLELKHFLVHHPEIFSNMCKEMGIVQVGIILQLSAALRKL